MHSVITREVDRPVTRPVTNSIKRLVVLVENCWEVYLYIAHRLFYRYGMIWTTTPSGKHMA